MPLLHHVNLGVPEGGIDAQSEFLIDVLGFHRVEPKPELAALGPRWFDDENGVQIHLSLDPDHRPASRAHVAVAIDDFEGMLKRLEAADVTYTSSEFDGMRLAFCRDPAGNRWELRGELDSQPTS